MGRFRTLLFCAFLSLMPAMSAAQGVDVGISGAGLLSIQPIDDTYVGGPYLSEGIGGIGPAFGVGVSAVTNRGLVVAAEFTTARFEVAQWGRLVPGPDDGSTRTRLRDSLLSALIGYATRPRPTRLHLLLGAAWRLDDPVVTGTPGGDIVIGEDENAFPLVLTGGIDILHPVTPRLSLSFGARYTLIERPEAREFLGIGSSVLRIGGGVRVRVN